MSAPDAKTILLVEDEFIITRVEKKLLENFGFKVITAATGEDAIEVFKNNDTIDLVLMDIDLGDGIDGTEAATTILKERSVPIVFLSSHTEPEIVEKTEKITSYGYILKNSGPTVLDASIKMAFKLFYAQQMMNERDERLQRAEIMAGFGSWELDLAQKTFHASEGARLIYGLAENELSAEIVQNCPLPKYRAMLDSALRDLIEQKAPYDVVFEIRRPNDGNLAFIHSIARYDAARNCVTGIIHDITERKRAEEKIIQTNDRYEKLSENCRAVFWEVDAGGLYTYVNNASINVYGLDPVNLCGRKYFYDLHPEKKREEYKNAAFEVFSRKESFNDFENEIELPDGGIIWVSTSGMPILDGEGNLSGYRGTDIDITNRKRVEEALRESESRFSLFMDYSPASVFLKDEDGRTLFVNKHMDDTLGASEWLGKNMLEVFPDEFGGKLVSDDMNVMKSGYQKIEEKVPHRDGSINDYETQKFVIHRTGQAPLLGGISIDITERKLAEEKIKTLLAEKEFLLKEVHHRIKNNMNTVAGIMSMQLDTLNEPSAVEALKDARSRVQSMMVLYDKLYRSDDFNKISFKDYFTPLVDEIIGNFPNRSMVKTEKNIDDFMIDAKRLSPLGIIINELLTNIMKYAFVGRGNGLITFSSAVSDGRVTISVGDNGIGIPESVDFSTSDSFGLQLVYMMTRQLRAAAKIDRDNGTKFTLEFKL